MTRSRLALVAFALIATACSATRPAPEPTAVSAWVEFGVVTECTLRGRAMTCVP